jgi:hypothetical protein
VHITYSRKTVDRINRAEGTELPMWFRPVLVGTAGMMIALSFSLARAQDAAPAPAPNVPQAATTMRPQTLKERLGDKASDEQRVDNCKVPPERRGSKTRPDGCEHEVNPASAAGSK